MKPISKDFQLAMLILQADDAHDPMYFTKLLKITGWDKAEVSRLSDKLMDLCMVYGDWEHTEDGWKYCFHIDEEFEGFVRGLYNTSYELKPCPFCGGLAKVVNKLGAYSVQCSKCEGKIGGWYLGMSDAIAEWNQRK